MKITEYINNVSIEKSNLLRDVATATKTIFGELDETKEKLCVG
jgi:hypothetical protein